MEQHNQMKESKWSKRNRTCKKNKKLYYNVKRCKQRDRHNKTRQIDKSVKKKFNKTQTWHNINMYKGPRRCKQRQKCQKSSRKMMQKMQQDENETKEETQNHICTKGWKWLILLTFQTILMLKCSMSNYRRINLNM